MNSQVLDRIVMTVVVVLFAILVIGLAFSIGEENAKEKHCQSLGGAWVDYTCLDAKEISLEEAA